MIPEGGILLSIQHLQHSRGGISPEIMAHFVDLVQQDYRILHTGQANSVHNPPRHRPDIGFAVTPDIRLVPDTAQRYPDILPTHGSGDGTGDRGLAHAGRPRQAEHLSPDVRRQGAYRQRLQNAFLYFLHAVMIPVQDLPRPVQIQLVRGTPVPGQLQTGVKVVPHHGGLVGSGGHFKQAVALLEQRLFRLFAQLQLQYPVAVLLRFLLRIVPIPQLAGNGLELLPQIILLLILIHLLLHLALNGVFQGQDVDFLFHNPQQQLGPLVHGQRGQHPELFLRRQGKIGGQIIRQKPGVILSGYPHRHIGRNH